MENLNTEILNCLQILKGSGKFAAAGFLPFTLPGLRIKEQDEVSFPLSENEAKRLITLAQQAPFGKASETIIDTSVRNTWEIDASDISFRNPKWQNHLGMILNNVKEELGIGEYVVKATLYKMLIYEEGGFFLPHKDSEKEKGMFGTLVIGLPSVFTGGALTISFEKETVVADFSDNSPYETDFVAFYADCNHEVKKVTSGYRVCLVYNLIQLESQAKIEWSSVQNTATSLAKIIKNHPQKNPYIILLGHQYTPESFSYDRLKLNDRLKAEVILKAAEQLGFYSKLCLVTSYKSGSPAYDDYNERRYYDDEISGNTDEMEEVYDESLDIDYWLDNETPPLNKVIFEEKDLITSFELDEEEPIIKENSGYMGNYGPDLSFWYHYGAVMIWSKDSNAEVFIQQNATTKLTWIQYFLETGNANVDEKAAIHASICTDLLETNWYRKTVKNYNPVVDWLIFQKDDELLLTLNNDILQKYFENIDASQWLRFLEFLPKQKHKIFVEKISHNAGIYTIKKITELVKIIPNNNWKEFATDWANQLPESVNNCYLQDKKRVESEVLENLFAIEKKWELSENWSSNMSESLINKSTRDEVRNKFAPELLKLSRNSLLGEIIQRFCINFLQELVNKKPKAPKNWTRAIPETTSNKNQWNVLKQFLASPTEQIFDYRKAQAERTSMEAAIKSVTIDLKMETIKKGSPHTLRLTKTQDQFNGEMKKWNDDVILLEKLKQFTLQ